MQAALLDQMRSGPTGAARGADATDLEAAARALIARYEAAKSSVKAAVARHSLLRKQLDDVGVQVHMRRVCV